LLPVWSTVSWRTGVRNGRWNAERRMARWLWQLRAIRLWRHWLRSSGQWKRAEPESPD